MSKLQIFIEICFSQAALARSNV